MNEPIPVTVLTGFLGAGKTTLLIGRNLPENSIRRVFETCAADLTT